MNTQDTLLAYSEWLDSKGLVMPGHASHDELAKEFIDQWMGLPLAGGGGLRGEPLLGLATTRELIDELHARSLVADTIGEDWPKYRTVDS